MKRTAVKIIKDAMKLAWMDLKNVWPALAVVAGYFLIGRKFLYSLCLCVLLTGLPCPGCGLTRAMFSILQGRFADAWFLHPFSYFILFFVFIFCVKRYFLRKETKSLFKWLVAIFVGMILFYLYRMIRYFPGEPPLSYYYGSLGYRIFAILRKDI